MPIYNELAHPLLDELVRLQEQTGRINQRAHEAMNRGKRDDVIALIEESQSLSDRSREVMRELQDKKYHAG